MFQIRNCLPHGLVAGALVSAALLQVSVAEAATESVVYSFQGGADAEEPNAGLINLNGILYGTTVGGGANGKGTVFSVNPTTGAETVVYSFCPHFQCKDGRAPFGGVIAVGGILYGTTADGGASNEGTVFSVNPTTGAETVVHSFHRFVDGAVPEAGMTHVGGILYGTTASGGANNEGTVFSLNPTTGAEAVVYAFRHNRTDGSYPQASVIHVDGILYGTTYAGGGIGCGEAGCGTVFSVNPTTGVEKVMYSFCSQERCTLEGYPAARLLNVGDTLYGTATLGVNVNGTVFSVNPATGAETAVYSFCSLADCTDGAHPDAGLIRRGQNLYSTTEDGGANGAGTVFAVNPMTGAETVVWSFGSGADGVYPKAGLINVGGNLYGTTLEGGGTKGCRGGGGCGTVFKVTLP